MKYAAETMPEIVRQKLSVGWSRGRVARYLRVRARVLDEWERRYPEMREALQAETVMVDAAVEEALYRLATGFERTEVMLTRNGQKKTVRCVIKQVPPNIQAIILWLKNRQPRYWGGKVAEEPRVDEWARLKQHLAKQGLVSGPNGLMLVSEMAGEGK